MPTKKAPPPDLIAMAFEAIAAEGWRGFSLAGLAERAKLSPAEVFAQIPSKPSLWRRWADRLDAETFGIDSAELVPLSPRERLFELIMRRFDALEAYRPALERLRQDGVRDFELAPVLFCNLDRLAQRLLDTAGSSAVGLRRRAARRLLMLAYMRIFQVWLGDSSEDRAATMAELDKRLAQLDRVARWTTLRKGAGPAAAEEPSAG